MHKEIEKLIEMALYEGQVTDKEREIILRKAEKLGLDVDEVEMYLENSKKKDNSNIEIVDSKIDSQFVNKSSYIKKFEEKKAEVLEPAILNKENEIKLELDDLSKEIIVLKNKFQALKSENENQLLKFISLNELFLLSKNNSNEVIELKGNGDYDYDNLLNENQLLIIKQRDLLNEIRSIYNMLVGELDIITEIYESKSNEYNKKTKVYLDSFLSEINKSISLKYGNKILTVDGLNNIIGLNRKDIKNYIKNKGTWQILNIVKKRKIKIYLIIISLLVSCILLFNNLLFYLLIFSLFTIVIISIYSKKIKINTSFLRTSEYDILLSQIIENYFDKFQELNENKKQIKKLGSIQKSISSISNYF
jgi:hypothetical protein